MITTAHPTSALGFVHTFFPLAVGNEWTYMIEGDTYDNGETVKVSVAHLSEQDGSFALIRKGEQDIEPFILVESSEGLREEGTERYLLRPTLKLGESWTGNYSGRVAVLELLDSGRSVQIGNLAFEGCLVTREVWKSLGIAKQITYAPGVGPIQYSGSNSTLNITSWKLQEAA